MVSVVLSTQNIINAYHTSVITRLSVQLLELAKI